MKKEKRRGIKNKAEWVKMPELWHCGSVSVESEGEGLESDPSVQRRKIKALDLESAKRKKKSGFKGSNVETVVVTAFHRKDLQATCPVHINFSSSGEIAGVVGVLLLFAIGSGTFLHALRVIIISAITATPCGL